VSVIKALALLARVVTGRCEGGRALTNAAIQFCAAVLLVGIPTVTYYAAPWAWHEYQVFRGSLEKIERMLEIREIRDAAKDAEQDEKLARIERRQDDQGDRMSRLSDRISRIEGRQR
jgi:hypothetical protein